LEHRCTSAVLKFDDLPVMADHLIVFARAPRHGTVKTRLAADVGDARALAIHRELTERVVGSLRTAADVLVVAFTPPGAASEMRRWLGDDLTCVEQCNGDLGARLATAVAERFFLGARRVVVVGTDCPTVDADTVARALAALETHDVVFGPATDGGYYLVGMRTAQPALFADVPWSSAHTLAVTLERARDAGLRVLLLEEMRDVDTAADWQWHLTRAEG
jgi:rSAM/selenodomain-associated transferase 1